jgi:hypothetical protein
LAKQIKAASRIWVRRSELDSVWGCDIRLGR